MTSTVQPAAPFRALFAALESAGRRPLAQRLLWAALCVAGGAALRAVLLEDLGRGIPYITFYPAVVLASLLGSSSAGLLATLACAALAFVWVQHGHLSTVEWLALAVFTVSSSVIALLAGLLHRALRLLHAELAARRATEEALGRSAREWQTTFDATRDAVWVLDHDCHIVRANRAAGELFGRAAEAVVGRHCWEIAHGSASPLPDCPLQRAARSGRREVIELPVGERWFEVIVDPILDAAGRFTGAVHTMSDITARKQAEARLRREQELSAQLIDAQLDTVVLFDPSTKRAIRWNRRVRELSGYTDSEIAALTTPDAYHDPSQLASVQAAVTALAATGHCKVELDLLTRDKRRIPFEYLATTIPGENGPLVLSVGRDLTERRALEQSLQRVETHFRLIAENTADIVWLFDIASLRFLYVSPSVLAVRGFTPEEACAQSLSDTLSPESHRFVLEHLQQRLAAFARGEATERVHTYEFGLRHKDGRIIPAEVVTTLLTDSSGRPDRIVGITRDLTERQKSIESLQESEARYRALFELESDALFLIDNDTGEILEANRAATLLYGRTHDELVRLRNTDLSAETGATRQAMQDKATQVPVRHHRRADGSVFPVEIVANHFNWAGRAVHLAAIRDITERLRREDELRRASLRAHSLLRIAEPRQETDQEFLDRALAEALAITDSRLGYIYHYDEGTKLFTLNTWSKEVLPACRVAEPRTTYELDRTGIWGEAVRQRRPIILNDFAATHPLKKGYPEGHVALTRFLTIPVFDGDRIIAVVGVANKPADYDEGDIVQLQLLMGSVWRALEHRRAELRIRDQYTLLRGLLEAFDTPVFSLDPELRYTSFNRPHAEVMRALYGAELRLGTCILDYQNPDDRATAETNLRRVLAGTPLLIEAFSGTGAARRFFEINHTPIHDAGGKVCGIAVLARDLTARRTMEETLRESESRFRAIVQNADAVIFVLDREGRFELSEGRGLATLGQQPGEVVGRSALAVYKDHPEIGDLLRDTLAGRTAKRLVHLGSQVLDLFVTPRLGADRAVTGVIGLANDITARVRAEAALRESERFARATIDALSAHLCVLDERGLILATNRAWNDFAATNPPTPSNYGPGTNYLAICDATTGDDQPYAQAFAAGLRAVLSARQSSFSLEYPCNSPTQQRWFLAQVNRFPGDGPVRAVVAHEDLTGRKLAEDALLAAHANLETVVRERTAALAETNRLLAQTSHLAQVGGWEVDLRTGTNTWTGATREIHEVDDAFVPSVENAIAFYAEESRPVITAAVQALATAGTPFDLELAFITARGRRLWVRARGEAFHEHGTIVKIGGTFQDVTARRRADDDLRRQRDQLEQLLAERTAANERLRELDRLKSEFLSTMSHELRTPLNSIVGFTGILVKGLAGPLNPEQQKQLGLVQTSARHLLVLINDLLDLSRIESGRMVLQHEEFDFATVVEEVLAGLRPLAEQRSIELTAHCRPAAIRVRSDRRRTFQVLLNLANNAVKFTERGGVAIAAHTAAGRLIVAVRDTGIGIRPEQLPLLFEAFRQLDGSYRRNYEGTGLGLHLCKKLLSLLGGDIAVASEPGVGSTFTFTLPLAGIASGSDGGSGFPPDTPPAPVSSP